MFAFFLLILSSLATEPAVRCGDPLWGTADGARFGAWSDDTTFWSSSTLGVVQWDATRGVPVWSSPDATPISSGRPLAAAPGKVAWFQRDKVRDAYDLLIVEDQSTQTLQIPGPGYPTALALSPDGRKVAVSTVGDAEALYVWTNGGNRREWPIPGADSERGSDGVSELVWREDGVLVGRVNAPYVIAEWTSGGDVTVHELDEVFPSGMDILGGSVLITGSSQAWVVDLEQDAVLQTISSEHSSKKMRWAVPGHQVLVLHEGREETRTQLFDLTSGETVMDWRTSNNGPFPTAPDQEIQVITHPFTGWPRFVRDGAPDPAPTAMTQIEELSFSPDGSTVLTRSSSGLLTCSAKDGSVERIPVEHASVQGYRYAIAADWASDGSIVQADLDQVMDADVSSRNVLAALGASDKRGVTVLKIGDASQELYGYFSSIAWSPDGKRLALSGGNGSLLLDDKGQQISKLLGASHQWSWVDDDRLMFLYTEEWGLETLKKKGKSKEQSGFYPWIESGDIGSQRGTRIAVSPDGEHVAIAEGSQVHLFELSAMDTIVDTVDHGERVTALAWGPGGQWASGSERGTVAIWPAP